MPNATDENIEKFLPHLNYAMDKYRISNYNRITCFIAQIAHESGSLKYVRELADGMAYEGRRDLGNVDIGDGPKYKGRGLIQLTGRNNYITLSEEFGVDLIGHPERLEQPMYAANSAGWFWKWRGLNEIADYPEEWRKDYKGKARDKFEWISIKINGFNSKINAPNGLPDRIKHYELAKNALPKDLGYKPVSDYKKML